MFDLLIDYLNKYAGPVLVLRVTLAMCVVSGLMSAGVLVFQSYLPLWVLYTTVGVSGVLLSAGVGVIAGFGLLFLRED